MTDARMVWLHAQIDDDERLARACSGDGKWAASDIAVYGPNLGPEVREHMARNDPARELREVEFKRRILAIHRRRAEVTGEPGGAFDDCCDGCGYEGICDDPKVEHINDCPERRALATVYSDRSGYQEMWGQQ